MTGPKRSPLDACHRAAGAKMVGFGGWEMPLSYPEGTIAEHMACRRSAAVFDVSHLGTVRVHGADAFERLQGQLCNDLAKIAPGRAQYTQLLDESDASVVDDIIVWWLEPASFDVMPNASNTAAVVAAIGGADTTATRAVIAVQGPQARGVVAKVVTDAASVPRFAVAPIQWQGKACLAAGTGYTGEDGVEIAVPTDVAPSLWDALVEAGASPAGLGARDTLRLEAALPLHGHELGPGITPLQAGLGWVVGWSKKSFRGMDPLVAESKRGPDRLLRGLRAAGRQPPRAGDAVSARGELVGHVTSGNFSPVLGCGIAFALVSTRVDIGDRVQVEIRGRSIDCDVVALPFVRGGSVQS